MTTVIARNALITAANPTAPDWIELIPAGPLVVGVDGRQWRNDTPDRLSLIHISEPTRPY